MMLRVARMFVSTDASAQEIVQETWLAVVRGLERFEGRSTLRTWAFRILTNLGKTRGVREARTIPLSAMTSEQTATPTVDASRFRGADDDWPNGWTPVGSPRTWSPSPEDAALAGEIRGQVADALRNLPERQRTVVSLRDVHGMSADEVCVALDISAANQRVLLHRGRARLRETLEDYYRGLAPVMSS
jgi:RNA polymerase sigma-70 factor (ECF subfamily)